MTEPPNTPARLASLDQFRGYTVAGMFLVNFLGGFAACPYILKHTHIYCSYADTIMPHFLFAVGFAFRLTFGRRVQTQGLAAAYGHAAKRMLGLALVAIVYYGAGTVASNWDELTRLNWWVLYKPIKREWFQTLMHIAITSLWILPVIRAAASGRHVMQYVCRDDGQPFTASVDHTLPPPTYKLLPVERSEVAPASTNPSTRDRMDKRSVA